MGDEHLHDQLRRQEESLWIEESRFDRDHMDSLLAAEFVEIGRSGRLWKRGGTLDVEPGRIGATIPLPGFTINQLGPDVALVTYTSETGPDGAISAKRCSIWRRIDSDWQLAYHQGTATEANGTVSS